MPKFKKDALVKMVNEAHDKRTADQQSRIAALKARPAHEEAVLMWRKEATASILGLAERLTTDEASVTDEELIRLRVGQFPDDPSYEIKRIEQQIAYDATVQANSLALLDALVTDKVGTVTLSLADLHQFGIRHR